jgi:hypothetical protein
MGVSALCEAATESPLLSNNSIANSKVELDKIQLSFIFQAYASQNNCKYRDQDHHHFVREKIAWKHVPKLAPTNFSFLLKYSLFSDELVRSKYSSVMLFANRTANAMALKEELTNYVEVNPFALSSNNALLEEMKAVLKQIKTKKYCA